MSGMARGPERRPLEAKGSPPKLSWEVPHSRVCRAHVRMCADDWLGVHQRVGYSATFGEFVDGFRTAWCAIANYSVNKPATKSY